MLSVNYIPDKGHGGSWRLGLQMQIATKLSGSIGLIYHFAKTNGNAIEIMEILIHVMHPVQKG
jgi:hypothetical protein